MVQVQRPLRDKRRNLQFFWWLASVLIILFCIVPFWVKLIEKSTGLSIIETANYESNAAALQLNEKLRKKSFITKIDERPNNNKDLCSITCSYKSISDLSQAERYPVASEITDNNNRRHMIDPPKDGKISLVCCETTAGYLSIAVHHNWAPLGAQRFIEMVRNSYFSTKVALMRCVQNFICQFGIAGDPSVNKHYRNFQDDPNWLPEGPKHRKNEVGVKRFAKGYFAYAGAGKNSRSTQFIVALGDNERLGGGSPWEVPWGEVVGAESYETLAKIYTGYGEKGPTQGLLNREGSSPEVMKKFPHLDYMTCCVVVDESEA